MRKRDVLQKPPIEPIYWQERPNQTIELGQKPIRFELKKAMHEGAATAAIRFAQSHRLEFTFPMDTMSHFEAFQAFDHPIKGDEIKFTDNGVSFKAFCSGVGSDSGIVFAPRRCPITITPIAGAISDATIHLFNIPNFIGPDDFILATGLPPAQGSTRCGQVVFKADGWKIVIAATEQTRHLEKELKAGGGFVITHVGQVSREDSSTFNSESLEELLTCLRFFLSFCLGRWTSVALAVGFDAERKRVYESWGLGITADGSWNGSASWFDLHHGELIAQVFPGFHSLWTNRLWREPLAHAVYWYLGASDRRVGIGPDTGLILAQTALELLAWTYCVVDRKMISEDAFSPRGLSAADKIRLLVSALGIPIAIPTDLSAMHARRGKKWVDGMDAITEIRNSLVHSTSRTKLPENSYYEAWQLSLWYIDLILLRLCQHQGSYANRLADRWTGETQPVPWATPVADLPPAEIVKAQPLS